MTEPSRLVIDARGAEATGEELKKGEGPNLSCIVCGAAHERFWMLARHYDLVHPIVTEGSTYKKFASHASGESLLPLHTAQSSSSSLQRPSSPAANGNFAMEGRKTELQWRRAEKATCIVEDGPRRQGEQGGGRSTFESHKDDEPKVCFLRIGRCILSGIN